MLTKRIKPYLVQVQQEQTQVNFILQLVVVKLRIGGGANVYRVTGRLLRDPSSWYHLVCAFDTTQGSDANRIKFYINGQQVTNFSGGYNTISNGQNTPVNESGKQNTFGAEQGGGEQWKGYMTHMVLVDGAQLTPSNFGETDATTGSWKPKPEPTGVTYGTNGVFMKCENSGNLGLVVKVIIIQQIVLTQMHKHQNQLVIILQR